MSYMLGDTPARIVFELPDDYEPDGFIAALVTIDGDVLPTEYDPDEGTIVVEPDALDTVGILRVLAALVVADDGGTITIELDPIVVENPDTGWATLGEARRSLSGADVPDYLLASLLDGARTEILLIAPRLAEGAPIPTNYRDAQIMQTRNKLNAARVGPSGDFGDGSFALSRFPVDWAVLQLVRPKRGIPSVG